MRIQDIRKKSGEDLAGQLADLMDQARTLRFRITSREVKNNQQLRMVKRDIARILTIIRERKNAA